MKNVVSGLQEDWFLSFKDTDTHLDIQPGPSSLATPAKELGSVQSLSQVRLFATPWTAARQAYLSITNSWSPPRPCPMRWCHPTIPSSVIPFSSDLQLFPRWAAVPLSLEGWGKKKKMGKKNETENSLLFMMSAPWVNVKWTHSSHETGLGIQHISCTNSVWSPRAYRTTYCLWAAVE